MYWTQKKILLSPPLHPLKGLLPHNFLLLIFIAFGLSSCGEDPYQIERKLDMALDTTFLAESKILKPKLDSICKTRYQTDLPRMVDSIVAMRKKQIEAQIERLKKQPK